MVVESTRFTKVSWLSLRPSDFFVNLPYVIFAEIKIHQIPSIQAYRSVCSQLKGLGLEQGAASHPPFFDGGHGASGQI